MRLAHPAVRDGAVVRVPDTARDEQIVAFVVLNDSGAADPDELLSWCTERLARFRVPSVIEPVDALPRTAVGKIQKHHLRNTFVAARSPS